ncbi:MAG TPA: hypothetical protein VJT31_29465 [Rugosimonospora sp.]|nr:hypothetical protein [Rugosimonospora sp.]
MIAVAALTGGAVPASANTGTSPPGGGWVPVSYPPYDAPAGLLCDFPVHWDVVVNHVRTKVVATYPDGSPQRQLAVGALFLRVSNVDTGARTLVDASGSAVITYGTDGSMVWFVVGPVIARIPAGSSNLPRGMYTITGVYRVAFSPTGFKTITLVHGRIHNLCPDLA